MNKLNIFGFLTVVQTKQDIWACDPGLGVTGTDIFLCFLTFYQPGFLSFLRACSSIMSYSDDSRVYTVLLPSSSHTRCQSDPHRVLLPVMSMKPLHHIVFIKALSFGMRLRLADDSELKICHIFVEERGRGLIIIVTVMTLLSFLKEHMNFWNRTELLGPSPYCLGNTGNRKLPPIHFLIGWNRLQKNCVFSCMATS